MTRLVAASARRIDDAEFLCAAALVTATVFWGFLAHRLLGYDRSGHHMPMPEGCISALVRGRSFFAAGHPGA